jgi:hypothetical protein
MEYWRNGIKYTAPDPTPEEIAEMQAERKQAEREHWAGVDYGEAVSARFREKYPQRNVEAIQNNYLLDPTNEEYRAEFFAMQEYRAECKAYVKERKAVME